MNTDAAASVARSHLLNLLARLQQINLIFFKNQLAPRKSNVTSLFTFKLKGDTSTFFSVKGPVCRIKCRTNLDPVFGWVQHDNTSWRTSPKGPACSVDIKGSF